MELKLLNSARKDLVDPDGEKIRTVLTRLSMSKRRPARAALIHDNGRDFIQFRVKKKDGKNRNCYVQYCENQEDGADSSLYFTEKKTIDQVIKLFQMYAVEDPKWQGEVDWKPFKPKWPLYRGLRSHRQIEILATLFTFGFFAFIGALISLTYLAFVPPDSEARLFCVSLFCASLFCFSSVVWLRPGKVGFHWPASGRSSSSSGGDGGGGGCGGGGCGGGGE